MQEQITPGRVRNAVILIHGIDGIIAKRVLSKLERRLRRHPDFAPYAEASELSEPLPEGRSLHFRAESGAENELHLYEASWGDFFTPLTNQKLLTQMRRGFQLIRHWARIPVLKLKNAYIVSGGLLTALGLILWWFGLISGGLNMATLPSGALLSDWIQGDLSDATSSEIFLRTYLATWMSWPACLTSLGIGALLNTRLNQVVNILNFAFEYQTEENLREAIWNRIHQTAEEVLKSGKYERITFLSHSFGTVIHIDLMSDFKYSGPTEIRHITTGSPAAVMSIADAASLDRFQAALSNPTVKGHNWKDFYSESDWMCTAMPDASQQYSFGEPKFQATARLISHYNLRLEDAHPVQNFIRKLNGQFHTAYFDDPGMLNELVHPSGSNAKAQEVS